MRILDLPEEMQKAVSEGKINDGHTRPLLMLGSRPEEQMMLFKEIVFKRITVREAELTARRQAPDRARSKELIADPELIALEEKLRESLGTRVKIERQQNGGKIMIDFFSNEDLKGILDLMQTNQAKSPTELLDRHIAQLPSTSAPEVAQNKPEKVQEIIDDIYSVKNFSV